MSATDLLDHPDQRAAVAASLGGPPPPPAIGAPYTPPAVAALSPDQPPAAALGEVFAEAESAVQAFEAAGPTFLDKLKSRKLMAAVAAVVLSATFAATGAISHKAAVDTSTVFGVGYIAVEGIADAFGALGLGGAPPAAPRREGVA